MQSRNSSAAWTHILQGKGVSAIKLYSKQYIVPQGKTWDMISIDFYDTPYRTKELIDCNPKYADILIFEGGEALNIPILEEEKSASIPPWKRG